MEYSDILLSLSELAVALAGFASVVSVFSDYEDEASRAAASSLLRMMLEISFRNAAFALLPLPFLQFVQSDPTLWRISSGLLIVVAVVHALSIVRRRGGAQVGARWLRTSVLGLLLLNVLTGLANVAGMAGPYAFSLYVANLLFGLGVACLSYLSVAGADFQNARD